MRSLKQKFMIIVSIVCLVLTGSVSARSIVKSDDAFPAPGSLYAGDGAVNYGSTHVPSMSLRTTDTGGTVNLAGLGDGTFAVDSFFDVFFEVDLGGGTSNAKLTGPVQIVVTSPGSYDGSGTFQTEIVSMSLSGDAGGTPVVVRESPTLASGGQVTLTRLPDGNWAVDSFFDVFTELSVDGGAFVEADGSVRMEGTGGQVGEFYVTVGGDATDWNQLDQAASGGDGLVSPQTGELWVSYPQGDSEQDEDTPPNVENWPTWWNEWWYDDPYDPDRVKIITLSFDYSRTDPQITDGYAIVTVNWSTTDWSLNPPTGTNPSQVFPPEDFDPTNPSIAWVGRGDIDRITLDDTNPSGHYTTTYQLPIPYNPEWVSVDVRGYNFSIINGQITHECLPDPTVPDITIEQLDWPNVTDSAWGRVKVDYNLSPGIYYFNLSVDSSGADDWVVQNLSIESLGGDESLMTYFDLGVADGSPVGNLNYAYSIGNVELTTAPATTTAAMVSSVEFRIGGEDGVNLDSGPGAPPRPAEKKDATAGAGADPNSGVIPDKDKFVNQPQEPNQCAPGAISNSLKYLQARGKIPGTIPTSISDVGSVIGSDKTGTPATWYLKKATHYKKHVNTRTIDAPLTVAKIQELVKELKDGQDIEIDWEGHVGVLGGIRIKPDGTVDLDIYDDNQTDDKSDPMHTSPLCGPAGTDYVDRMKLERFVIECPKETPSVCMPSFSLNTADEWLVTLEGQSTHTSIKPMTLPEWTTYMELWQTPSEYLEHPEPEFLYPENEFIEPQLYVYEGDSDPDNPDWPDDGGLVMGWGNDDGLVPGNDYASAYKVEYGEDPDLSNCIITVAVTAPVGIGQVSLGLETPPLGSGNIRSWYWNCGTGAGFPIQSGVPTTITIDTSIASTAAATPTATNYVNAAGFNLTNVLWILVDENATWMGSPAAAPVPGGPLVNMWNYWHWLMVSPKTTLTKALLTKHSQGPIVIDTSSGEDPDVPLFWGWDEKSDYHVGPIAADDWECTDNRPVTDFHWWGSFPGWTEPYPPCHPVAFHIGIWTDTPAVAGDPESYSHPKKLVWEHICDNYVWNFAGYDRDPRQFDKDDPTGGTTAGGTNIPGDDPTYEPNDSCFQYNQLLDGDDWFYQEPNEVTGKNIYWLSIAPIWDEDCDYEWGWKTRPKFFMDNAVSITAVTDASGTTTWPPVLGSLWSAGVPLQIPAYTGHGSHADAISWDLAFEISTNEPAYEDDPIPGDVGGPGTTEPDGTVDLNDLAIVARNWLTVATP
ncbi:MAG: DUF7901 domain-containing protein [Planctomycetota bacterium]|jgi:hypothetical protein